MVQLLLFKVFPEPSGFVFFSFNFTFVWCLQFVKVFPLSKKALLSCSWLFLFKWIGRCLSCPEILSLCSYKGCLLLPFFFAAAMHFPSCAILLLLFAPYALPFCFDLVWWEVSCATEGPVFPQLWCEQGDRCASAHTHRAAEHWWAGRRTGFSRGCLFGARVENFVGVPLSSARVSDPPFCILVNRSGNFFMSPFLMGLRNNDKWRIWNT